VGKANGGFDVDAGRGVRSGYAEGT